MTVTSYIAAALESEIEDDIEFAGWSYNSNMQSTRSVADRLGQSIGWAVKRAFEAYDEYQAVLTRPVGPIKPDYRWPA